ncbi:MAG TPA: hypothetical protein VG963_23865 [Polyangiaceae bacterium]|nr:hypothetical protein [Polyangiaceae bacterium]
MKRRLGEEQRLGESIVSAIPKEEAPNEEAPNEEAPNEGASKDGASGDGGNGRKLSAKEWAREARRRAYRAAKARRAADPRQAEFKEKAKLRRREQYQRAKQQRKEALAARGASSKPQQRRSALSTGDAAGHGEAPASRKQVGRYRNLTRQQDTQQHGVETPAHQLERKPRAMSAEVLRMKAQLERMRAEPPPETELTLSAEVDVANDVG